jgi:alpha-mannosidase
MLLFVMLRLPGNAVTEGTLMVSLLRAPTLGAYGLGGGYEPGMTSDTGLQLGKPRTLHYALLPHAGDWRSARVYLEALELNQPLLADKVAAHAGGLPPRWGFLEVSNPDVVVSALKPGPKGNAILRVYEAAGRPAKDVRIKLQAKLLSARDCDLLENPGGESSATDNAVHIDLAAFEIKTIEFALSLGTLASLPAE